MENVILIAVLVAIFGGAVAYIVKAKRNGVKCIGCSAGGSCGGKKGTSLQGGCGNCSGCNGGSRGSDGCGSGRESGQDECSCGSGNVHDSCACHRETK